MNIDNELDKELDAELDAEIGAELDADLSEPEVRKVSDPNDVPRTEEGFNMLSPIGLVGAAASKIFGLDTVEDAVKGTAKTVTGALAGAMQSAGSATMAGIANAANTAVGDALNPNVDVSVESMYNAYAEGRQEMEGVLDKAVQDSPIAGFIGNTAGTLSLMKAFNVPMEVSQANMASMAKFNFAHGYVTANSDDNRIVEGIFQSSLGFALDKIGLSTYNKWQSLKSMAKSNVGQFADETALDVLTPKASGKIIRSLKGRIKRDYKGDVAEAAKDAEIIMGINSGARTLDDIASSVETNKGAIGSKIKDIIDSAEVVFDPKNAIDGNLISTQMKQEIGSVSIRAMRERKNLTPALRTAWESIDELVDSIVVEGNVPIKKVIRQMKGSQEYIDPTSNMKLKKDIVLPLEEVSGGEKIFKQFTPASLFDTKVKLAKTIDSFFEKKLAANSITESERVSLKEQKSAIVGKFTDLLDDTVNKLSKDELSGLGDINTFRKLNRQYGMSVELEKTASKAAEEKWQRSAFKLGSTAMTFKGFFLAGMGGIAGGGAGVASGLMLNFMIQSPTTPVRVVQGLRKLHRNINQNPQGPLARRLQAMLLSGNDSPEVMEEGLTALVGEVNLIDSAVARNSDDVISKANSIEAIIRNTGNEEMAQQFKSAIESGNKDAIGSIMETLEDIPQASEYLEPGKGWDGKVFSPEKKAVFEKEIEGFDVSRRQKSMLKKEMWDNNILPQVQQEPDRFLQHRTRDKSKPAF